MINKETEIIEKLLLYTKEKMPFDFPDPLNENSLKSFVDYKMTDCDPYEIVKFTVNLANCALERVDWNYLVEKFKVA